MSKRTTLSLTDLNEAEDRSTEVTIIEELLRIRAFADGMVASAEWGKCDGKPLDPRYYWAMVALKAQVERSLCESILLFCGNVPEGNVALNDPGWLSRQPPDCGIVCSGFRHPELPLDGNVDGTIECVVSFGEDEETGDWIPRLTVTT